MSERTCSVYIIMTANDVARLPPEFTRKGRVDEIFGVFLPTLEERIEILQIHLRLKGRDPDAFDLDDVPASTDGYSGADIKEVVTMGLQLAFHSGEDLTTQHLMQAVPKIRPLSKADPGCVSAMTAWLGRRAKPANGRGDASKTGGESTNRRS